MKIARQGRAFAIFGAQIVLSYECAGCAGLAVGEATQAGMRPEPDTQPDVVDADTIAFSSGYISIVPIQADYTADDYESYADLLDRK